MSDDVVRYYSVMRNAVSDEAFQMVTVSMVVPSLISIAVTTRTCISRKQSVLDICV